MMLFEIFLRKVELFSKKLETNKGIKSYKRPCEIHNLTEQEEFEIPS